MDLEALAPFLDRGKRGYDDGDCLCPGLLQCVVVVVQLDQLAIGTSAAASLEEGDHDRAFRQLLGEGEFGAIPLREREVDGVLHWVERR